VAFDHEDFVTNLAVLSVTGVVKRYELGDTPPDQIPPANFPAQWLETASIATKEVAMGGVYEDRHRGTVVIAVGEIGMSTSVGVLFAAAVTLATALRAALVTANNAGSLGDAGASWDVSEGRYEVGGVTYIAAVAQVQGNPL